MNFVLRATLMAVPLTSCSLQVFTNVDLPSHALLRPPSRVRGFIESPSSHIPPNIGDRVINIGSPTVPFGLKGTLVAIHPSTGNVEVVFDGFFADGTTLHGMCSRGRGSFMPWAYLLNLSKKSPIGAPATEAPTAMTGHRPVAAALPVTAASTVKPVVAVSAPKEGVTPLIATKPSSVKATQPLLVTVPIVSPAKPVAAPKSSRAAVAPIAAESAVTPVSSAKQEESVSESTDDMALYWKSLMSKKKAASAQAVVASPAKPVNPKVTTTAASSSAQSGAAKPAIAPLVVTKIEKRPTAAQPFPAPPAVHVAPPAPLPPPQPTPPKPALAALDDLVRRAHQTEGREVQAIPGLQSAPSVSMMQQPYPPHLYPAPPMGFPRPPPNHPLAPGVTYMPALHNFAAPPPNAPFGYPR